MEKPRYALAYSLRDPVGSAVASIIRGELGSSRWECPRSAECYRLDNGVVMGGFEAESYQLEHLDESPDPDADVVIVLSRHSASSGKPSLTTHHTGNPTSRTLGGDPYRLAYAAPPVSRALLRVYRRVAGELGLLDKYSVTLEATHHGPTRPRKPLVFIEVGSTPEEWRDQKALQAMALTVIEAMDNPLPSDCRIAAGFGEPHYPIKMTTIHLDGDYCLGHIIPRYALQDTREEVLVQAVERNWPRPAEAAIVHKKSVKSAMRKRLVEMLEKNGLEVVMI